jgi:hypothetical protein
MISAIIEGMMLMLDGADEKLSSHESGIVDEMRMQIIRIAMDN